MNKEQAIKLLMKEDINTIFRLIEQEGLSITYCAHDWVDLPEVQKWSIDDEELIDFISYYYDFNLHWSQWANALIEEFKKCDYKVIK